MCGSSIGITRSSSESIRSSQVLPLRDEPKIQANRPGAFTEISGFTPSGTLPLFLIGMVTRSDASRGRQLRPYVRRKPLDAVGSARTYTRPDQQDETDQDADDAERVVDEHGKDDPDHDE